MAIKECETFKELTRLYDRIDGLAFEDRASAYAELLSTVIQAMGEQVSYEDMQVFLLTIDDHLEAFCDGWNFGD